MADQIDRILYPTTNTNRESEERKEKKKKRKNKTNGRINLNKFLCLTCIHIFDSIFRFISFHSFDVLYLLAFYQIIMANEETKWRVNQNIYEIRTQISKCLFHFRHCHLVVVVLLLFLIWSWVVVTAPGAAATAVGVLLVNRPRDQFQMSDLNSFLVLFLALFFVVRKSRFYLHASTICVLVASKQSFCSHSKSFLFKNNRTEP